MTNLNLFFRVYNCGHVRRPGSTIEKTPFSRPRALHDVRQRPSFTKIQYINVHFLLCLCGADTLLLTSNNRSIEIMRFAACLSVNCSLAALQHDCSTSAAVLQVTSLDTHDHSSTSHIMKTINSSIPHMMNTPKLIFMACCGNCQTKTEWRPVWWTPGVWPSLFRPAEQLPECQRCPHLMLMGPPVVLVVVALVVVGL
jgi:hypothetical protein